VDGLVINEKLESLRRCVQHIEDKTPETLDALERDVDIQDVLVLNLTRAVQVCVDIGAHIISQKGIPAAQTMGDIFVALQGLGAISEQTGQQMKKAIGFRNIAVHSYQAVNWEIVYAACHSALVDFRQFAQEISHYCQL
jgi:uncharacterized protein YutE (UPF0331/DUF86 family)